MISYLYTLVTSMITKNEEVKSDIENQLQQT